MAADDQRGRTGKQTLLRETNDRVLRLSEGHSIDTAEFLCECGERGCARPVRLTLSEYAELRRDPTLLVVARGHPTGSYEVVHERPEYTVVRTPGREGETAEVQSRLLAIRAVLEREGHALSRGRDGRLLDVLVEIDELKLSITRALTAFERGGAGARDS